jgi:hypothetical protein
MSQRLPCPGCGHTLRVPDDRGNATLTCPHCLARVPGPEAAGIQREPPGEVAVAPGPSCPECGQPTEPGWRVCPYCREPLRPPRAPARGLRVPDLDLDVRRNSRGTGGLLVVLAVLGGLGAGYALLFGIAAWGEGDPALFFLTLAVLFVLGLVNAAIVYTGRRGDARPPGVGRVVVGTLAWVGGLLVLGVAVLVFLFAVCLAAYSGFRVR